MTDIENEARRRLNEAREGMSFFTNNYTADNHYAVDAMCRLIEEHEAFRREVSDAAEDWADRWTGAGDSHHYFCRLFDRFIIPKPVDPLVEAMQEIWAGTLDFDAAVLREALAARGYEIRRKGDD